MITITKKVFEEDLDSRWDPRIVENLELKQCHFERAEIGTGACYKHATLNDRTTIRNVSLIKCTSDYCSVGPVILDNVLIDTFRHRMVFVRGACYRHVTLKGNLGNLIIDYPPSKNEPHLSKWVKAIDDYHKDVDWALDISGIRAQGLELRSFPAHLVRRDPEIHALVKADKLRDGRWKSLPYATGLTPMSLEPLVKKNLPATIVIANTRGKYFEDSLEDIKLLRKEGIAEPD